MVPVALLPTIVTLVSVAGVSMTAPPPRAKLAFGPAETLLPEIVLLVIVSGPGNRLIAPPSAPPAVADAVFAASVLPLICTGSVPVRYSPPPRASAPFVPMAWFPLMVLSVMVAPSRTTAPPPAAVSSVVVIAMASLSVTATLVRISSPSAQIPPPEADPPVGGPARFAVTVLSTRVSGSEFWAVQIPAPAYPARLSRMTLRSIRAAAAPTAMAPPWPSSPAAVPASLLSRTLLRTTSVPSWMKMPPPWRAAWPSRIVTLSIVVLTNTSKTPERSSPSSVVVAAPAPTMVTAPGPATCRLVPFRT